MSTDIRPRRGAAERVTGAIWGAIVAAAGGFLIAALSGYDIDLELVAIVSLTALGGWLLFSAIAAGTRQSRQERAALTAQRKADAVGTAPNLAASAASSPRTAASPRTAPSAASPASTHQWSEPARTWDQGDAETPTEPNTDPDTEPESRKDS